MLALIVPTLVASLLLGNTAATSQVAALGADSSAAKAASLVSACKTAFNNNDLKTALADCNKAIALDPTVASAYALRGDVKDVGGDHHGALAATTPRSSSIRTMSTATRRVATRGASSEIMLALRPIARRRSSSSRPTATRTTASATSISTRTKTRPRSNTSRSRSRTTRTARTRTQADATPTIISRSTAQRSKTARARSTSTRTATTACSISHGPSATSARRPMPSGTGIRT